MSDYLERDIVMCKRIYKCRNCDAKFEDNYVHKGIGMGSIFNIDYAEIHKCSKNVVGLGVQVGVRVTKWYEKKV